MRPPPQSPNVVSLSPGQYGDVTVYSGGRLILSAGTYAFTSLDLEPGARIVTPSATAESVDVFVRSSVIYRGSTVNSAGTLAPLFLAYLGTLWPVHRMRWFAIRVRPVVHRDLWTVNVFGRSPPASK